MFICLHRKTNDGLYTCFIKNNNNPFPSLGARQTLLLTLQEIYKKANSTYKILCNINLHALHVNISTIYAMTPICHLFEKNTLHILHFGIFGQPILTLVSTSLLIFVLLKMNKKNFLNSILTFNYIILQWSIIKQEQARDDNSINKYNPYPMQTLNKDVHDIYMYNFDRLFYSFSFLFL